MDGTICLPLKGCFHDLLRSQMEAGFIVRRALPIPCTLILPWSGKLSRPGSCLVNVPSLKRFRGPASMVVSTRISNKRAERDILEAQ